MRAMAALLRALMKRFAMVIFGWWFQISCKIMWKEIKISTKNLGNSQASKPTRTCENKKTGTVTFSCQKNKDASINHLFLGIVFLMQHRVKHMFFCSKQNCFV